MNHLHPCKATLERGDSMSVFRRLKTDFPCLQSLSARGKRGVTSVAGVPGVTKES